MIPFAVDVIRVNKHFQVGCKTDYLQTIIRSIYTSKELA